MSGKLKVSVGNLFRSYDESASQFVLEKAVHGDVNVGRVRQQRVLRPPAVADMFVEVGTSRRPR